MRKCLTPGDKSFFMPRCIVMGEEQKKRFHQLASEVQIENPSFVKVLRKSSFSVTGSELSCKFCSEHLPKETRDVMLCLPNKEKTWSVKNYYRRGHQTFKCNPWAKFVQETKLQEGDMCLFELVKAAKQITFIVHVSRAT
ncbi:B3 domain-containing protein Os12g0592300-like [Carex rostrata]